MLRDDQIVILLQNLTVLPSFGCYHGAAQREPLLKCCGKMSFSYKTVDAVPATPCCSHLVVLIRQRYSSWVHGGGGVGEPTHPLKPAASTVSSADIHTVLIIEGNCPADVLWAIHDLQ